jgi:hypothetical protein
LQHPARLILQVALHVAVPPWYPCDVQVGTPAVPSHSSPAPTRPSPQQTPLLQLPAQLAGQVPTQPSEMAAVRQVAGQTGLQQPLKSKPQVALHFRVPPAKPID